MPVPLSRRRFLLALAAIGARPALGHAADENATLEIIVDKGKWGTASPADIRTVMLAAAEEIWRYCPGQLIRPIRVYHRTDFPLTDFSHDLRGRIKIGLASEDTRWAQMAFQFSHEFCHALAQHSAAARRAWRTPRHANLWFEESLCETGSLFVLRRLATAWRTQPPDPQWRTYAAAFANYTTERLARPDHQLPEGTTFSDWFEHHESGLRLNGAMRAKNVVIARQMLPIFEAAPSGWDAVSYLNLGKRDAKKSLVQYFEEWRTAAPPARSAFIGRIAALFA
jgi:hypothetical protein